MGFKKGDNVAWKWSNGLAEGVVEEVIAGKASIQSKGKTINRNGSEDNPAIKIKHSSGTMVLKLASEIQSTDKS